jgi:hypothetical protein
LTDEFKKLYVNSVEGCEGLAEYRVYAKIRIDDSDDELEEELEVLTDEMEDEVIAVDETKTTELPIVKKMTAASFTTMLANYAKTYAYIRNRSFSNPKINNSIFDLQRIKSVPSYTFLLELFSRDTLSDSERLKILKMIAVFMLRRHICSRQTGPLDDIFSDLVNKLDDENVDNSIKARLIKDMPSDEEFQINFIRADYKRSINRAKYVMEQFEYKLHETAGEFTINSGVDVHLEHIIPQTISTKKSKKEFGDWELYLGDGSKLIHGEYVNRIGNFTLLGQKLNIVASNSPFEDKVVQYKKSSLKITKDIVDNYEEFKFEQVKIRSSQLAKKALKIWKIS